MVCKVEKKSQQKRKKRKEGRKGLCTEQINVINTNFDSHYLLISFLHLVDPYGDLTNAIGRLVEAMAVGTNDERDPYLKYLVSVVTTLIPVPAFSRHTPSTMILLVWLASWTVQPKISRKARSEPTILESSWDVTY